MARRRSKIVAAGLAFVSLLLAAPVALGWTQLKNNFPDDPQSCDNSQAYPCYEWPTNSQGFSIYVDVYLFSSLANENINLTPDVINGWGQWNAISAVNPFYQRTTTYANQEVEVWAGQTSDPLYWAETFNTRDSFGHVLVSADIIFNTLVTWNHSYTYDTFVADSRKVATHELGHSEALGHTAYTAVMRQGAASFWKPRANDIDGIQTIYPVP